MVPAVTSRLVNTTTDRKICDRSLPNEWKYAMAEAWEQTTKVPLSQKDIAGEAFAVRLPLGKNIVEKQLRDTLASKTASKADLLAAAEKLAWYQRSVAGQTVNISSLRLGNTWLLNLPGELVCCLPAGRSKNAKQWTGMYSSIRGVWTGVYWHKGVLHPGRV